MAAPTSPPTREGSAGSRTTPRPGSVVGMLVGLSLLLGLAGLVAVAVLLPAGLASGAFDAPVAPFPDPGAVVRFGLPVARVLRDLAAATTVGLLVLAAFVVPESPTTRRRIVAARGAAVAAGIWLLAGLVTTVLTFADFSNVPLTDPGFGATLLQSALPLEPLRVLALNAVLAAVVATGAGLARTRTPMAALAAVAVLALLPLALTGHAGGSAAHDTAVDSLTVHLVASSVWVGGLLGLVLLRPTLGPALPVSAARYSVLAGWCFAAVAGSGVVNAWLRLGGVGGLATTYGLLVVLKVAALVSLGAAGWRQRRAVLPRLAEGSGRAFARLALAEVVVMGAAFGLAAALSRSASPVPESPGQPLTPVLSLTGYPAPDRPLDGVAWFTVWRVDWFWLSVAMVAVGLYLAGVVRLRRRGDRWPAGRAVLWACGWAVFLWAVSGAPGVYGRLQFSMHMTMHMVLSMVVPIFLVLAAPVTLALRALPARTDRTLGPRELLLGLVHSTYLSVLANPVVAAALFFASLVAFYNTGLFELALTTHTGHVLMIVHFLLTGYLFAWVLVGVDPGPRRWPPVLRLLVLFATVSFHAFFGVALTSQTTLLAPDFYRALALPYPVDLLADQQRGGAIAWGVGEVPTLVLAILVTVAWLRADAAESRRQDRQADRDDDAQLRAYNAALAARAGRARGD
ncbi:MAG TPA: bifunctional copper resistance protein CopD/cytochrome c oxidase assembly protein [Dermatophilaceae bacterium]|nr:bifunctional copper resistance protein CopD/cytochrome c oxidase assembly protein [Dermatophilaceae bacterium]